MSEHPPQHDIRNPASTFHPSGRSSMRDKQGRPALGTIPKLTVIEPATYALQEGWESLTAVASRR
jgi:hypothetical protein